MDAKDLRQVLDIKKLHSLYSGKRAEFTNQIRPDTHNVIADKLALAALSCDLCLMTYQALQDSLLARVKDSIQASMVQQQEFKKTIGGILANHDRAIASIEDVSDASTRNLIAETGMANLKAGLVMIKGDETRDQIRDIDLNFSTSLLVLCHTSLCDMFSAKDSKVLIAIITVLLKTTVSLIPGTETSMILLDIQEALDTRRKSLEDASDELKSLDDYTQASHRWSILNQASVEMLKNHGAVLDYETCLQAAKDTVSQRFDNLVHPKAAT